MLSVMMFPRWLRELLQLVDDPELATRMGRIGRQRLVTTLSWELQVPKLLAAYERALEKGRSRQAATKL